MALDDPSCALKPLVRLLPVLSECGSLIRWSGKECYTHTPGWIMPSGLVWCFVTSFLQNSIPKHFPALDKAIITQKKLQKITDANFPPCPNLKKTNHQNSIPLTEAACIVFVVFVLLLLLLWQHRIRSRNQTREPFAGNHHENASINFALYGSRNGRWLSWRCIFVCFVLKKYFF